MENHRFLHKVSRLFPSSLTSCRLRTVPDVAENSVSNANTNKNSHENDSFCKKPEENPNTVPKHRSRSQILGDFSNAEGRKSPLLKIIPNLNRKERLGTGTLFVNQSSSSNSGWFSSGDEKSRHGEVDTFFSLSSNSGDSFRLKASQMFRKRCEEMKSINEMERCSFSSLNSFETVLSNRKTAKKPTETVAKTTNDQTPVHASQDYEIGFDQISAQIYYSNCRSRKTARNRRKTRRKNISAAIEECCAVEKYSMDPRGDFRASMVEMIVEKQMFGAEDLERLLSCFLSLNSASHHAIILDVFSEICETLFSY